MIAAEAHTTNSTSTTDSEWKESMDDDSHTATGDFWFV